VFWLLTPFLSLTPFFERPLRRPLTRRKAANRHLHCAFTQGRGHLSRSTRCPTPSPQAEPFTFSRQVIAHTRCSSRFGRP
jgi:hypothetical protein